MEVDESRQPPYPAKVLPVPFRSNHPHSVSVDNFKPSSRNDKQTMTLPIVVNQNRDKGKVVGAHCDTNKPSLLFKDSVEVDLASKSFSNTTPYGKENSPPVIPGEHHHIGDKTSYSQTNASDGRDTRNVFPRGSSSVNVLNEATSANSGPNMASVDSMTCNNTPNPFGAVRSSEPLRPPKPTSPYKQPSRKYPSLFQDQFTQFMEDRMVQFRPSSSQNNIETSLYGDHPYQVSGDSRDCIAMRTWNNGRGNVSRSALPSTPAASEVRRNVRESPVNESNSSFLPRGMTGPSLSEPAHSAMAYTPQAVPLEDAKLSSPAAKAAGCICMPWNF